jgi:hypothetical protein
MQLSAKITRMVAVTFTLLHADARGLADRSRGGSVPQGVETHGLELHESWAAAVVRAAAWCSWPADRPIGPRRLPTARTAKAARLSSQNEERGAGCLCGDFVTRRFARSVSRSEVGVLAADRCMRAAEKGGRPIPVGCLEVALGSSAHAPRPARRCSGCHSEDDRGPAGCHGGTTGIRRKAAVDASPATVALAPGPPGWMTQLGGRRRSGTVNDDPRRVLDDRAQAVAVS